MAWQEGKLSQTQTLRKGRGSRGVGSRRMWEMNQWDPAGSTSEGLGKTHPCSWRSWGCAGCRAPANEGSQAEEGEKRREQRGGRLEGAKHHQCHGFAKSWRDKAATWGLHTTKVTGWARIRIWILSRTLPFFRERK